MRRIKYYRRPERFHPSWTWTGLQHPAGQRQGCPASGYYLNNMYFFTGFHGTWEKLKWKETEKIETRKEV
jgi:hypothetical protein